MWLFLGIWLLWNGFSSVTTDSNEPNVSGIKLKDKAKKKAKQRELVALKETAQEQNA